MSYPTERLRLEAGSRQGNNHKTQMAKTISDEWRGDLVEFQRDGSEFAVFLDDAHPSGCKTYDEAKKLKDAMIEQGRSNVKIRNIEEVLQEIADNE